jgi:hypothetical protein
LGWQGRYDDRHVSVAQARDGVALVGVGAERDLCGVGCASFVVG